MLIRTNGLASIGASIGIIIMKTAQTVRLIDGDGLLVTTISDDY